MNEIAFEIPGKPFAKQRPRMTRNGRVYTPKETVSFERVVGQQAALKISEPLTGALRIDIIAVFEPPKSWSKKKRLETMGCPHVQRPDYDNIAKAVSDGLNRIAYADDSQIAEAYCRKVWGPVARTTVIIKPIDMWRSA